MINIPKYKHYIWTTEGKKAMNETIFCFITTTNAQTNRRNLRIGTVNIQKQCFQRLHT